MSDSSGSDNKLSVEHLQAWKQTCHAKFLSINAHRIVAGKEPRPTPKDASNPTPDELRREDGWHSRQSMAAGYLRGTLDAGHIALIQNFEIEDVASAWKAILDHFESKTADTRMLAIRKLVSLRKGSPGHEEETFTEWGVRCISAGNAIKHVLPEGPKVVPSSPGGKAVDKIDEGYTAINLIDDMIINTISVGLGDAAMDERLQENLTFTAGVTLEDALKKLENADNLILNKSLNNTSANALTIAPKNKGVPNNNGSRQSQRPPGAKRCDNHPKATSHTTAECSITKKAIEDAAKKVIADKKARKKARAAAAASHNSSDDSSDSDSNNPTPLKAKAHRAKALVSQTSSSSSPRHTHTPWNTDTGATRHMTSNSHWFRDLRPSKVTSVQVADDRDLPVAGEGPIVFQPIVNGKPAPSVVFERVLYVPDLKYNLFSVFFATRSGKDTTFQSNSDKLCFVRNGETLLSGKIVDHVGHLEGYVLPKNETAFVTTISRNLLHKRLGHIGKGRLETLIKLDLANGIPVDKSEKIPDVCEHCIAGKQHRDPFPQSTDHRSTELLGRIHSDVHGKLPRTPSGWQYWITFVDCCCRWKQVYLLKKKSDAFAAFKEYVAEVERKHGVKVKELRDDKGGEYFSTEMDDWCKERGITRQRTVKATPSQNGVAERLNRTLAEGVIAMLNQAGLKDYFWGAAVLYLTNILNATPSSALSKTTSYEVWNSRKPDLRMYRIFGCAAYANIEKRDRKGFAPHSRKTIFIGFQKGYKGWNLYDPKTRKMFVSRDVIFDEKDFPGTSTKGNPEVAIPLGIRALWPDEGYPDDNSDRIISSDQKPPAPLPTPHHPGPPQDDSDSSDYRPSPTWAPPAPPIPQNPPPPSPTLSSDWEEGKNNTGRMLTQLTPPRYGGRDNWPELPEPSKATKHGRQVHPPASPTPGAQPYAEAARSPPPSPPPIIPLNLPQPARQRPVPMPAQGNRPIRPGRVMDYAAIEGVQRRTTQPWPRRRFNDRLQAEEDAREEEDVFIGHGGNADAGGEQAREAALRGGASTGIMERGGAYHHNRPSSQSDNANTPLHGRDEGDDGLVDALKHTPLIESVNFIYGIHDNYVDWITGHEIAFDRVKEKALAASTPPSDAPRSFKEAMSRHDADKWMEAAQAEIDALTANGTWELVPLPEGRRAIGSRWVFLIKRKADGEIDRYKARFVAQGFSQRPDIDFNQDELFAPTVRPAALRAILAQAALAGDYIESIDISNAYLNGELEKDVEIYMRQPEGFEVHAPDGQHWVCRLIKGLYGLKQSGRLWHQKLGKVLAKIGFIQIQSGPSIYVWEHDGIRVIVPVHVDDITITSPNKSKITEVKKKLAKKFKIKELGPTSYLLGIKVDYNRKTRCLQLSQRQYIVDMLNRFNLSDCKPVTTPMDPGQKLSSAQSPSTPEEVAYMRKVPYMNAVGALMYLAIGTRPDIAYTVSKLAQFNSNPGQDHWHAVKHLFRYLQGTLDLKLTYRADPSPHLSSELFITYSDADHAGDLDTRKSTSGYVVKMGTGAISWSSKKQTTVALSSTEAEYVAAVAAGKELLWMRALMRELRFKISGPSLLFMDNQSAIATMKNPEHHGRMKHLDIAHHWIRDEVQRKNISVKYIDTNNMVADILTKALARAQVEHHRLALGLME